MDERIIKYFLGDLEEDEQIELLKKRDVDAEIKGDFSRYQNVMAILSLSSGLRDNEKALHSLHLLKRKKRNNKIKHIIYRTARYAAAISLIIISTWFFTRTGGSILFSNSAAQQELYVPVGQRARISLPDGTIAWLNAGSTLTYPSVFDDERIVFIDGEAYFEVAKDDSKPFIVETGKYNIKALGTKFNVYNYSKAKYQHTILVEGSVKIYKPDAELNGVLLNPNQQLFFKNGEFSVKSFTDKNVLLWKDGIYSFENEKLDEMIDKLELYFDVEIIIKNPSLLEKEYTGKFRQKEGIMEILRIIRKIHPFNIEKDEKLNRITLT
jgi:Fe2+-dicitrate sensor, membrane component